MSTDKRGHTPTDARGTWIERTYRRAMRLYPADFRQKYGAHMLEFQRDRIRHANIEGRSTALIWCRAFLDLVVHACAERTATPRPSLEVVMRTLPQDVGYAMRGLVHRPVFSLIIVVTIALGVGANSAIFSVVNGILLRPLPYREADRIVSFGHEAPTWLTSDPNFLDYQAQVSSLESLAAYTMTLATLSSDGEPERVRSVRVSDDFFHVLGVSPMLGRTFGSDEFRGNPPTSVVLSYGLWKHRFGGNRAVVNSPIVLNGVQRVVVGIMPPFFNYPEAQSDIWVPMPRFNRDSLGDRANDYLFMVGKFKAGVSVEHLRKEANMVAARIMTDHPGNFDPKHPIVPRIELVGDQLVKNSRPYLAALLGAVGFVLLIACANVANLLLARAEGRRREMAVRSALGASRRRLVTQMFTECGVLAFAGGALGLAVAWGGNRALIALAPGTIPRLDEIGIDWRVMLFTMLVSLLTGLFIGVMPAMRAARDNASEALKSSAKSTSVGVARGARRVLVIAEVALAVMALSGAGMLLRSLWRLERVDLGFNAEHVLTARLALPQREYNEARTTVFYEQLVHKLEALPGVQSAGASGWLPVVDAGGLWGIALEGRNYGQADEPSVVPQQVTPGYFASIGIRVVEGRDFTWADRDGAMSVAIVSREMARQLWPGEDVIGKRFKVGSPGETMPYMSIVGVVGDIRSRGFTDTPEPTMYFPHAQSGRTAFVQPRAMALIVHTTGDPMALALAVKSAVHSLDPMVPVSETRTLDDVVGTSVATRRFSTTLLVGFAALALLLAGLGTYGVIAYGVSQRTYEIGVRMALGAERFGVMQLVVLEGVRMCGAGLLIGLAGSIALGRGIRALLYNASLLDVPTMAVASAMLLVVAMVASVLPARRVLAVSPTEALRGD